MMASKDYLIGFESDRLGYGKVEIAVTKGYGIVKGVTAIAGRNGSGKTTLGTILEKGRYAYGNRLNFASDNLKSKMLSFSDIHSLSGMEAQYFTQRMESTMNDMVPTVAEILGDKINSPLWHNLISTLGLRDVADKKINYLSSGELRKLIIVNALLDKPGLLILDNPYIGLDAPSRQELDNMLLNLKEEGVSVVLLVCDDSDIPGFTDAVITLLDCRIEKMASFADHISQTDKSTPTTPEDIARLIPERPQKPTMEYGVAFEIRNGHVRYGNRQILEGVDWTVKKGEQWALTGPNGCGKSLLLSMVCADNPQAYANDITLFDHKRGSGESIWEIKDAIGYVSPEMQLFFKSNSNVKEIIAQGLRNSLNRYGKITRQESEEADKWLNLLRIGHLSERRFNELSAGEQRLVLVARAMIKQPELLVLDEPLHGLDAESKQLVRQIIDTTVTRNGTSLIFVTHYEEEIPEGVRHTKRLKKSI